MLQRSHSCCAYRRGGVEGEHEHTPLCVSAQLQVNNMSFTYEYGEIGTATTRTWFLFLKSRHRPLWYPRTSRSQTWRHWDRERQARLETPEFISWDKNTTRTFLTIDIQEGRKLKWEHSAGARALTQYLGKLSPGGHVRLRLHGNEHDVGLPLGVRQERVLTRVLSVVQHLCFPEITQHKLFTVILNSLK